MIHWGIIGLGNIAHNFARAFHPVRHARLLSVASRQPRKLQLFKEAFRMPQTQCYSDYDDLINNDGIDIVYIALPHHLHFEWVVKCINNNKNVLVEKPATMNAQQMKKINTMLDNKKLFFAEGFMYRYHPQTKQVIDMIQGDEIGELLSMKSYFGHNIVEKKNLFGMKKLKFNKRSRLFDKQQAGGAILDLGCYPVSMSTMLANLKSDINSDLTKLSNREVSFISTGVDIDAYVDLCFDNDFTSSVGCSFKKHLGQVTTVQGTKGELMIEHSWHCNPATLRLNGNNTHSDKPLYDNIFSYEIESISHLLIEGKLTPCFPAVHRHETESNMKIIDRWLSHDEA